MVILQFNKLIRNKWFWGAFALVISAAFCFEGLFDSRGTPEKRDADAGTLSGRPVDAALFRACVADVREAQSRSGDRFAETEVNKNAAKLYAALETAGRAGVSISDAMLADRIVAGFGGPANFDSAGYAAYVAQAFGLSPDAFEQRMRRRMTVQDGLLRAMLSSAVWVSPAELERAVEDATDTFTVKIVSFRQDKKDADAVKVDEAALKKWYDENTSKIELPELVKLRMVRYQTSNTNVLAKMEVSDNDMHDWYDSNIERFTSTDTNGVETVRKFEEVKDEVEREVRKIAAANYYETNLLRRAYMKVAEQEKGKSRLDAIAREDGVAVVESGWFSPTGRYVEGFTVRRESVAPGARNFAEVVAELDPESEDLRYGVVTSPSSVWLVEKSAVQAPKTPTFEEAKGKIDAMALRDAKAEAFKAQVEAVIAKGEKALLAEKNISTNIVFVANEMHPNAFPNARAAVGAAMKLSKGGISEFVSTGPGRAIVVYCVDRTAADAAKTLLAASTLRDQVSYPQFAEAMQAWEDWNLARLGFVPGPDYPIEAPAQDDDQ